MKPIESRSWNWDAVDESYWNRPAPDVYFLLHRWKELGFTNFLDLGCGIGRHSLLFGDHGFSVTAADLSESGLRKLREAAFGKGLKIASVRAHVQALPFKDCSFDCALAFHSIYHVYSDGMHTALSELRRVLKAKAEIYLTLISKSTFSYTDPRCTVIDKNVRLKVEEDGNELPHFFVDQTDIKQLFTDYKIIVLRQIEDIFDGKSSWHYFLHGAVIGK